MQQLERSFAAERAVALLGRIREALRKTLDFFQSEAFRGGLDEVSNAGTGDIDADVHTAAACLLEVGMTPEEGQRLCGEWERCCDACGLLYLMRRFTTAPPKAIADDPDPRITRENQVWAKRLAKMRADDLETTNRQTDRAKDAVSVLLAHVADLVSMVKPAAPVPAAVSEKIARPGTSWQEVAAHLEQLRSNGEAFGSHGTYAAQFDCSSATVNKAIRNTPSLQEWARGPVSVAPQGGRGVIDIVLDNVPQTRESGPTNIPEPDDGDVALRYLMENASPDERAKILAMSPDKRRELAEHAYRDPERQKLILSGDKPHRSR